MRVLLLLLVLICATSQALAWSHGAPAHSSSVGINLGITNNEGNGSTDLPFLNVLKGNQGWVIGNTNNCGTATGTLGANPLTTTNGSTSVQVTQTAHGLTAGVSNVHLSGATAFNNVTLNGNFAVQSVVDANNYTVTAATTANASGSGGGSSVVFVDLIGSQDWSHMQVDGNGYPTTMAMTSVVGADCTAASFAATEFAFVAAFGGPTIPTGEPFIQRGTYVLLYNGVGTISVTNGCNFVESGGTGRDIYNCSEFGGAFVVHVTAINASTPIKDYAFIYSPGSTGASGGNVVGANETLYNNGPALTGGKEIWAPQFIARVKPFAAIRFMDAFQINTNAMVNWSDRTPVGCYSYTVTCPPSAVGAGLPFEAAIALCNEFRADCWLNVPVGFSSSAITSYATLAHNNLNAPLRAIVESGNEYWLANFSGAVNSLISTQAATCGTGSTLNQGIVNSIQVDDAWLSVWGSDAPARLIRTISGQSGFQTRNQFILSYTLTTGSCAFSGTSASHATHFNAAPYWDFVGNGYPIAWSADTDPYLKFFEQVNGSPLVIPKTTAPSCTTAGTTIAYTASSNAGVNCGVNGSVPATPANGTFVVVTFNQPAVQGTFSGSVNHTVLTVDVAPAPTGVALGPGVQIGRVSVAGPEFFIVSNGTGAGGAGTYNLSGDVGGTIADTTWDSYSVLGTFSGSISGTTLTVDASPIPTGTLGPGIEIGRVSVGGAEITIVSQQSGTPGGAGSYTINQSKTIADTTWNSGTVNLKIDGGNPFIVTTGDGRTDNAVFQWILWTGRHIFCFTNANVDGIITPTWRDSFGDANDLGTMPLGVLFYTQNYSDATNAGLGLVGYESGQNFVSGSLNPTRFSWFAGAQRDPRMGLAELSYRTQLKSVGHGALTMQYNHIGPFTNFGYWSYMEGLLAPGSPRFNSVQNFK